MFSDNDFPKLTLLQDAMGGGVLNLLRNGAIVSPVPQTSEYDQSFAGRAGVYFPDGRFVPQSNVRRSGDYEIRPSTLAEMPKAKLAGRHLYAGQICRHFGHFLVESLARLWPLMAKDLGIQSVLFIVRRRNSARHFSGFQTAMFKELGIDIPITIVDQPLQVEELIVPEQGFGDTDMTAGNSYFRRYIRENLAPDVAADGPDRLYLSRDGLKLKAGRFFNEENVTKYLTDEGYEEFRPETVDYKTQIARYRAAKQIVGAEGSAFHLFGFVGHSAQKVALISRRSDDISAQSFATQLRSFCQIEALVCKAILREWDCGPQGSKVRTSRSLAELDFPKLAQQLHLAGFKSNAVWRNPNINLARKIPRLSSTMGRDYQQVFGPDII